MTEEAKQLPVRDDLKDLHPYGAPQLDVPVQLNTNENPYAPSPALQRAIAGAVAAVAGTLNRYPDRDATDLRKDLADYLGHDLTAAGTSVASGQTGTSVLQNGVWKVGDDVFCGLLKEGASLLNISVPAACNSAS